MSTVRKPTTCQMCLCDCGLMAVVEDDRVVGVEGDPGNPQSRGGMCVRGVASPGLQNAPDRVLRPLRRTPGGDFEEIGWEQALGEIAGRLGELRERHGPASLCLHYGRSTRFIDRAFVAAFARLFGTRNVTGVWSLCVGAKVLGYEETFGPPLMPWCDFPNARLIVLWGTNPAASRMHRYFRVWHDILAAQRSGAKLVVVDPRAHATARAADVHLPLNPGTDLHLALALLRILADEGWWDEAFLAAHAEGVGELREHLRGVDVAAAGTATGLGVERIRALARDMGEIRPAAIDRREGTIHQTTGTQLNRALSLLSAVTGNVDVPGGLTFNPVGPWKAELGVPMGGLPKPFWAEAFPLSLDATGELPGAILGAASPPIRGLICVAANPASGLPETETTLRALRSLDLLVVNDLFLTETARQADYVLPGATFFEKGEFETGPFKRGQWVKVTEPVVSPRGEARAEWRVLAELAARLGHTQLQGFENEDQVMRRVFDDSGRPDLDPRELRQGRLLEPVRHGALLRDGFHTASGKIRLRGTRFAALGYAAFPAAEDGCPTSPEYPLRLVTGARVSAFTHSQHRNLPTLRRLCPGPEAEISCEVAESHGVRDGDLLRIETAWGGLEMPVRVVAGMNPVTVSIPHGWAGPHNANRLLGLASRDPVSATPAYKAVPCRVARGTGGTVA